MGGDSADFEARLSADLKQRVATLVRDNPGMSPEAAMQKAEAELLTNNPFRPPTHGCPSTTSRRSFSRTYSNWGASWMRRRTNEGIDLEDEWETDEEEGEADEEVDEEVDEDVRMGSPEKRKGPRRSNGAAPPDTDGEDSDDEDGEEEEDGPFLPFQMLVSHICKHWRVIALGTHTLWTTVRFVGHLNADKGRAWLERSNGLPLDIFIDCTDMHDPDHDHSQDAEANEARHQHQLPCCSLDDLKVILDMILPRVQQWRVLEVSVNFYTYMYEVLSRIAQCPSAPLLEELGLETFQPAHLATAFLPFHGIAPKLTHVAFWGVHIAWDDALPFLQGLREIELAYHTKDVRPSFATFRAMLDASPELDLLSLCFSGPTGDMEVVEVPSLRNLVLCYLEQEFVQPLIAALVLPALEDLTLDLSDEDYTDFAKQLAEPARGQPRSLLAGLTTMKLAALHCNDAAADLVMAQLDGLKRFHIKLDDERHLRVEGVEGAELRKLVAARKAAGAPFSQVFIGNQDFVSQKDEAWLRANVSEFDFFEPSDSEEEVVVGDAMDTDGDD
ncbi:hypothetical protein B0H13DRAFT_2226995 [Mycena leptocephala]|nr:hypothetical protein B0H13DRAFT_2226995 [Mycena leptocephala]